MEEVLQPPATVPQVRQTKYFAFGIAASVLLHVIGTIIAVGLPGSSPTSQSVTFIDLNPPRHAAPAMTAPSPKPAPAVAPPKPETLPVAEKEAPPVPDQEPQPAQPRKAEPETPVAAPEQKVAESRSSTVFGLGLTKGYFKTFAEGETLRPGVKEYYLDIVERVNQKWWLDQQFDRKQIAPIAVTMKVGRNGEIMDIWVSRGSGNTRYDNAVTAALKAMGPLPPLPFTLAMEQSFFIVPITLVPPLNLMNW